MHQAQGHWLGPARVIGIEGGNVSVSHRATAIKCAKEQLRMASPAEREMREMLMRIGGDDPDERSKHGVPRQQDLTQQQPPTESPPQKQHVPPQSSSQPLKQQSRKDPRQQQFHPEPGPQVKQDAPRQQPILERQESRDHIKNHSKHHDRNNEFECKMIHQQLMMDGESDLVLWKQVRKIWRLIKWCVLGFQDPDLTEVPRDSPTLSAASEALIMQWVASHKYRLISGDIKTAFLSGDEDIRNIVISPPHDVRQMLNLDHETVLRLRKAVYGLVNAPKKWWDRLKKSLIEHGFTSCALDPCAFVLRVEKSMECSVCMSMM